MKNCQYGSNYVSIAMMPLQISNFLLEVENNHTSTKATSFTTWESSNVLIAFANVN